MSLHAYRLLAAGQLVDFLPLNHEVGVWGLFCFLLFNSFQLTFLLRVIRVLIEPTEAFEINTFLYQEVWLWVDVLFNIYNSKFKKNKQTPKLKERFLLFVLSLTPVNYVWNFPRPCPGQGREQFCPCRLWVYWVLLSTVLFQAKDPSLT